MADTSGTDVVSSDVTTTVADISKFNKYLKRVIPCLLDDNEDTIKQFTEALNDPVHLENIQRFLSDPQVPVLVVQKLSTKDDDEDSSEGIVAYTISIHVSYVNAKIQSAVFVKRGTVVDADKGFSAQLRVMNLSDGSPYETLHAIVSSAVSPYFKSYIRESGRADRDGDKMAPSVEKKIAELEMGLLHLQQNIDIPEITLTPHPLLTQVLKRCAEETRRAKVTDFEDKLEEPQFLNALQSGVNRWIKEIQKVTKLDRDPGSGTALQEISFWLNLERALLRIQEKRESVEVTLTLDILKHAKRFHAVVSFDTDTGLKQALATVYDYNPLMKDFPLNDLLSATELTRIRSALQSIFMHLRKIRNTKYPIQRALRLVEAISRDLSAQLLKVLGTRRLMNIPYDEFERVMSACFEVFSAWDDEYDKLQGLLRDIVKKKREEHLKMVWRLNPAHKRLQSRLDHMRKFRQQHEQLRQVIVRVLRPTRAASTAKDAAAAEKSGAVGDELALQGGEGGGSQEQPLLEVSDANAIDEVNLAYESVKEVDCLDVSKEGSDVWEAAVRRYDERIDRVETRITSRLRDLLGTAKNANEMFRIFSRFNALFVRPHIRGAIREYQTQLIQRVKDDIETLHEKFKVQYAHSRAYHMSKVRDLPPVAGSIIWARQIERQLNAYLRRVEDVLGKDWAHHLEGQKLKTDGESFKVKLNTSELFEDWSKNVQMKQLGVSGRIFYIEAVKKRIMATKMGSGGSGADAQSATILKLRVNFLPEIITLSKEVRNMKWLGFRVPLAIVNKAHQANQLYPFAISLIESVRTYESTCSKIDDNNQQNLGLLCAGLRKEIQSTIAEGVNLTWESYRLDPYVQKFAENVFNFQEKVDDLLLVTRQIDVEVKSIESCAYMRNTFAEILGRVQKAVDDLSLHQYSNLPQWVARLDEEVERRLVVRLEAGIRAWVCALRGEHDQHELDLSMDTEERPATFKLGGEPVIKKLIHELRITNQQIHLHPSIEVAQQDLMLELSNWVRIVIDQTRITHSRYQVGLDTEINSTDRTFRAALGELPSGGEALEKAFGSVQALVQQAEVYVRTWTNYQSLWDLQADQIYNRLGDDLKVWMNVLDEVKGLRKHFDVAETQKDFGPLVIVFGKVQSKVSLKYDNWHKDILSRFGNNLAVNMNEFFGQVSKARSELEQQSIDAGTTADAVNFITYSQQLKRKMKGWEKQVEDFKLGQNILYRDRFQFPNNWLDSDNVAGEWGAFVEMMLRKSTTISQHVASLQMKIVAEDKMVESRTSDLLVEWEKEKPVAGDFRPEDAVKTLTILEGKFARLREERDSIQNAKEALELTEAGVMSPSEDRVQVAMEELADLKGVWLELSKVWENIEQMKDTPWMTVQPRKLRQQIDSLSTQLKELPARFRQYSSYEHVKKVLAAYAKVNVLIVELKSEALKERHWKSLMRKLCVNWQLSELSLGQVWDIDLLRNETAVREVLGVAQGEKALEEFMKQVTEVWKSYELELINYQNKSRLIRGWDDLFNKVKEHISSVVAMKFSPYYKQFEEEALAWEDRLNRINALFDVWIDVQRRWVYLDGIFAGSADIKTLLPVESQRFQSVSTEFLGLMKKVSKSPLVMDVLNIPNVQRQLERLSDLLTKIQKSLGEYLERQRASFPRFYFVGDEDLLEIIGNSKNVPRLQKHFKKMFAGVHTITLDEDCSTVYGFSSKEGEQVTFITPVSIKDNERINDWLTLVEKEMRVTLAKLLAQAIKMFQTMKSSADGLQVEPFMEWVDVYQAQLVVLASQISWSEAVEAALIKMNGNPNDMSPLEGVLKIVENTLNLLADSVLHDQPSVRRKKLEHLIIEHVHQRDVTRVLVNNKVCSKNNFEWLAHMRFYFDPKQNDPLQQLSIHMANAHFNYGFEYLGVQEKLVQTPLTDRCYLTMTQALEARLGGSPFGPAGTGKTESVKALGNQLGRFVLVFNCDETFDFQAMGRIFIGLCQVGAWGCFDEFNRLEERMLSAVSQQIQCIQETLRELALPGRKKDEKPKPVELLGKEVSVNPDMAIFITMNPGYAGRSNLPDNLKKLFRSLAMTQPNRQLIAQVMLYSQGFRTAEKLASKVVPFFKLCDEQLSPQSHYDFGLRALKSVLTSAGNIKREHIRALVESQKVNNLKETDIAERLPEQEILIQSVMETVVPKLVAEDIPLLYSLLSDVFPGVCYEGVKRLALSREIRRVCEEMHFVYGEGDEEGALWVNKVLQLYQISCIHHGLMMVGPSGSGKTVAWRVLLKALERLEGVEGVAHVIDPKSISKDSLYGYLDPNTREWSDGLFTHILRKIIDSVRGESQKRQWIIFDGDVDPEWVENLNSVLDDNKLLTLPNGERLGIPTNVRIMFEVQDLKYATLATVSRCGMVWFSEDVLSSEMIFNNFLRELQHVPVEKDEEEMTAITAASATSPTEAVSPANDGANVPIVSEMLRVQREMSAIFAPYFASDGLVNKCLDFSRNLDHVMDFTRLRCLTSLFSILKQVIRNVLNYNSSHSDFPMDSDQMERYASKSLVVAIIWSMTGDAKLKVRDQLGNYIRGVCTVPMPPNANLPIIDFEVTLQGEWQPWSSKVPQIEVETHKVTATDLVVPTLDTVRHEALLYTWLAEHRPMLLCGPPGSGKTMTLFAALRGLPDMEVCGLNFSSATSPELMLKTFDQYCEYRKTPNGIVLAPTQLNKWLVFFCDEINLPDMDKYGTQRVISFLRQMVEHSGFYRTSDMQWVHFERIQFVGACNPPTDPGRKPLSLRFLRHVPVVYVDYPGQMSLKQIYGTFNRAMLRMIPNLRNYAEPLTNAMVEFYLMSQERFTVDMQPHYIYSPREMTRWVRGIHEALKPLESLAVDGLVRIWAHEALRLFQDRLVQDEERQWTDKNVDDIALKHFPSISRESALARPILYSNWLSKDYVPVNTEELRDYVKARLRVFYEEELDVPLVLFNQVLDHVLRIDRVFRQSQGHLLLIGVSGAGKTTLSRFVSWLNGLSVFQVKVHNKYTAEDFDDDLRNVLRRAGCKAEKITFIMDESNVMDSSFLERMNTLLANGEVPGLFEGDELATLMTQCKEGAARDGLMVDSHEELYKWFTGQICRNLHVVFTMNPSTDGLKDRAATSPALFNRCVLNWFGDWSPEAYFQVGREFTIRVDMENPFYKMPQYPPVFCDGMPSEPTYRDMVVNAFTFVHQTLHQANQRVQKRGGRTTAVTPRHYLDFINHFVNLIAEKRSDLEEQQLHLNIGLQKIHDTVNQVASMQKSLTKKRQELENMNEQANAKLKQMVSDQQVAEDRKKMAQELRISLDKKKVYIGEKSSAVYAELSQVEPAVQDAKAAVGAIKRQQLVEVRSLANPPSAVKLAIESICTMLGEPDLDWKALRSVIMRDNFIGTIVNFTSDDVTDSIRETMKKKYLNNPDYNFEKVNRASLACGPMVKWAIAQIQYAEMLKKVDPLRAELRSLEEEAALNEAQAVEVESNIQQLERSIARYKEEYAVLISQAQAIKADLSNVEAKVARSVALLDSLGGERRRWESGSDTFKSQMATIVGDCLLSSAFMAYGGYFDQHLRSSLFTTWYHNLQQSEILFREDLARVEYLSNPDERLRWQANSLPADELCVENAIMLKRYNRYPLIIDPSGQATEFIVNEFKDRKITRTSFLDDSFRKTLESALRFGTPLLVQDVESYDPILNPVLNREVRRTGGRTLITIGDQDIDLSPTFTIFLSTRDPTVEFAPDICSRVTFVNFTVTRSSLQNQCLNAVLKSERPDVDTKRSDLLKLQGEFQLKLRHLEKDLLKALNDAEGNILENDKVIAQLETLKKEAAEVAKKVEETDVIMAEVEAVSQQYVPLAQACSSIYFTLESMNQIHFLYQYSLHFFLEIFGAVLHVDDLNGVTDPTRRLSILTKNLFSISYKRVSRGMMNEDHITFAVLLTRIALKGAGPAASFETEFQHFIRSQETDINVGSSVPKVEGLSSDQNEAVYRLGKLASFRDLSARIRAAGSSFTTWLDSQTPELQVPDNLWNVESGTNLNAVGEAMYRMLTIQAFRPDRLLASAHRVVAAALGEDFMAATSGTLDLAGVVEREIAASTPILMCSVPGYDASGRVEDLANESGHQLSSIAIGSAEGFAQADKAINAAAKCGKWVMLKNVHLAPAWLVQLEKKLHSLNPHSQFRLFLTMEINPKLPVNLLCAGRVFVFEPPPGIKANLLRTFSTLPEQRMAKVPTERAKLYFLLAWFHAVVQERLRYAPLGWAKRYEFNESDLKCACDTIDTWVDSVALGRTNLPPEKVPWDALRALMSQCIYGGKIDNSFDAKLLAAFLDNLFTVASFEGKVPLVKGSKENDSDVIMLPEGSRREELLNWVKRLPDTQSPSWLGLPNNAERVLLTNQGQEMISKTLKMQHLEEDEEELVVSAEGRRKQTISTVDTRPAWMRQLHSSVLTWLKLIPKELKPLIRTLENIKDPMFRCFEREVNAGVSLLNALRQDLTQVADVCAGERKPTNHHREMMADLTKGIIPRSWKRYTVPAGLTVIQWVTDFSDRVKQLANVLAATERGGVPALRELRVWLGGLFMPEAYITATRQAVAQSNMWALEELDLEVHVLENESAAAAAKLDKNSFFVTGLRLMGAQCRCDTLSVSDAITSELVLTCVRWSRLDTLKVPSQSVTLPVYLNMTRAQILMTLTFATDQPGNIFYERGVAILSSMLG